MKARWERIQIYFSQEKLGNQRLMKRLECLSQTKEQDLLKIVF